LRTNKKYLGTQEGVDESYSLARGQAFGLEVVELIFEPTCVEKLADFAHENGHLLLVRPGVVAVFGLRPYALRSDKILGPRAPGNIRGKKKRYTLGRDQVLLRPRAHGNIFFVSKVLR
jgi:hypothetical protein